LSFFGPIASYKITAFSSVGSYLGFGGCEANDAFIFDLIEPTLDVGLLAIACAVVGFASLANILPDVNSSESITFTTYKR